MCWCDYCSVIFLHVSVFIWTCIVMVFFGEFVDLLHLRLLRFNFYGSNYSDFYFVVIVGLFVRSRKGNK